MDSNVKVYSLFNKLEHEASYNVPKGGQIVTINASNLNKGSIYIIQITVGGRTISQKINL